MNKNNYKKIIGSAVIFILLIILTFYVILKDQNINELKKIILGTNKLYLILALICMFVFILSEGINIKILLHQLGINQSIYKTLKYSMVGFFFSSITPSASGGQPLQIYYMKKDKINISTSTLVLLIILCSFQIVTLIFSLIGIIFNYSFVVTNLNNMKYIFIIGIILNIIVLFTLLFIIFSKKFSNFIKIIIGKILKLFKIKNYDYKMNKIGEEIASYQEGAVFIRKKRMLFVKVLFVTFIQLFCFYSISYFVYRSFNLSEYSYFKCLSLQAFLFGSVSSLPLPGGVGISEGGFKLLFLRLFTEKLINSAMIIYRFVSFYFYIVVSMIVVFFSSMFKKIDN